MITKRSKVCVPYLYAQRKCKSKPVYTKNKKGGGDSIIIPNGTVHFKKQTKTKQTK